MIDLMRQGDVFVLTMNAGENRFNPGFLVDFGAALDEVEAAGSPAALVTTGTGKFYSNGLDLAWMGQHREEVSDFLRDVLGLLGRVLTLPVATLAAVNGHAFGAGGQLVVAHDLAIMRRDRGYWCMPEIDMPAPLHPGMTALLQARLSKRTVHEAVVTGRRYTADEALVAGIVDEACDHEWVLPRGLERAAELVTKAHPIMRTLKRGLYPEVLAAMATDLESE
jgi:enoyl-CoA hydratase/carnithine racemase